MSKSYEYGSRFFLPQINFICNTKTKEDMHHLFYFFIKTIIALLFNDDDESKMNNTKAKNEIRISQLLFIFRSEVMKLKIKNNSTDEWKNQIVMITETQNKIEARLNCNFVNQQNLKNLMNDLVKYLKFGNPDWKYVKQTLLQAEAIGDALN